MLKDILADYMQRCHLPTAEMYWAGTRQSFFINNTKQLFWAENWKSSFSCWICAGKLRRLYVCLRSFGPNTLLSLFAMRNILLRTVHSNGNMITESSGLEKTSWGHLAPSGNLSTRFQHQFSQNKPVNNSHLSHKPLVQSQSVFSFVLQWNRLLNCISFCCKGVCPCTRVCMYYRSLIEINLDSSLLSSVARIP